MPLTVDLIRHVESKMNVAMADPARVPFIGGRQNEVDISGVGEDQAASLGRYAVREGILPTDFYSSPAIRTLRTHDISSRAMGLSVIPTVDDRLQELDQGDWTNQPRILYDDPIVAAEISRLQFDFAPPGGESMTMVYQRTDDFFGSLATRAAANESHHVWVHTHAVLINVWVGNLLGWSHEQTYTNRLANASLTRVVREADTWRVAFMNRQTGQ